HQQRNMFPLRRAVALLFMMALVCMPSRAADDRPAADPAVEQSMFKLINQERVQRGLPALKWSAKLQQAARKHSELMVQAKQLSHRFRDEADLMPRLAVTGLHF